MRNQRFRDWITPIIDANLPAGVKRIEWADTGINSDTGMADWCWGLVFETAAGGTAYFMVVHGGGPQGDDSEKPEVIVEGEPPAPVEPVNLALVDGKLRMADLEGWIAALMVNSQFTELASVERVSTRPPRSNHGPSSRFGLKIKWHDGSSTYPMANYTLLPGEKRANQTEYQENRDYI